MILTLLKAKIHRATVTQTDIDYNGSISIDQDLLAASGILNNERVEIYNITNGARFATYAIPAPAGSKEISINGAAARIVQKGDLVIICAYGQLDEEAAQHYKPKVILLNEKNGIVNG